MYYVISFLNTLFIITQAVLALSGRKDEASRHHRNASIVLGLLSAGFGAHLMANGRPTLFAIDSNGAIAIKESNWITSGLYILNPLMSTFSLGLVGFAGWQRV